MTRPAKQALPYRPCVGIMVLNRDGLVWVGRRKKQPRDELSGEATMLWQLPQGGIDAGEQPEEAARRELYEETGIRSIALLAEAPDWIDYDLPDHLVGVALKGKYRGQTQRWFAYRFTGEDSEIAIDPPPDGHAQEFDCWNWLEMAKIPELIVPFKRATYEKVVGAFAHLAGSKG